MPRKISKYDNANVPILDVGNSDLPATYFNIVRLQKDDTHDYQLRDVESVVVVADGIATIDVRGQTFPRIGARASVWDGPAHAVYVSSGAAATITCNTTECTVYIAGGRYEDDLPPFEIKPADSITVEVGSVETHSRRLLRHITGTNTKGRTGRILVSELYADPGCWFGYPPHKHDEDREGESAFEEVYYFKFNPVNGFGGQIAFDKAGEANAFAIWDGDSLLLDHGYHPSFTSPGHACYVLAILIGKSSSSLVQYFHEDYRYLTETIPGVQSMVDHFK